jgi:hypothetical protein
MKILQKIGFSKIALILVMISIAYIDNNLGFWKDDGRVIVHDVYYYYAYLPAIFIYDDIGMEKLERGAFYGDQYIMWPKETPIGKKVILTSCGMSYLYFPFFIVGHWYAQIFDYPITGYGLPYRFALMLSSFFYLIIGLVFLRRLLLKYFSELVAGVVILILPLTNNMLWYTVVESPMSHVYNFAIISTMGYLPALLKEIIYTTGKYLLLISMAAIGLKIHFKVLLDKGVKAVSFGLLLATFQLLIAFLYCIFILK